MPQGNPDYKGVWFVSEKRKETNELVIVKGGNNPSLFKSTLHVEDWAWLGREPQPTDSNLSIQYRSLQDSANAVKSITANSGSLTIELTESARAMAPGQNIVLYKGNEVLGAGVLAATA